MRLADFMKRERYTDAALVEKVNEILAREGYPPYSWRSVIHWRTGKVIPRPPVAAAIAEMSGNLVTYQDHVAENAPFRVRR